MPARVTARPATGAVPAARPLASRGMAAVLVAGAVLAGYGLARGAARAGDAAPLVLLALPLVPALVLAVLGDPRVGVVATFLSFPLGVRELGVVPLQVVQGVVVAVAVLVVLRRVAEGRSPLPIPAPLWWAVAFVALLLLALPSAVDAQLATREVGLFAGELLFASVVVAACRSLRDVRVVIGVLLAVIAVVGLVAVFTQGEVRSSFGGAVVSGRARGMFREPNQLGTFCLVGSLLGAGLAFGAHGRRGRVLAAGGGAMAMLGLVLSLSRGAWIGFVVGTVALVVALPEARRVLALLAVPLVLLGVLLGAFAPSTPQVEVVGARLRSIAGEQNPYDNRPTIWREARNEIEADPLTGHGPGSFPVASERATSESRTTFAEHAHNQLLTWASEDGVPAAAAVVGLAVHCAVLGRRARGRARAAGRMRDAAVVAGIGAALAGVLGQGLVDYTLRNSVIVTTVFALLGAYGAALRAERVA